MRTNFSELVRELSISTIVSMAKRVRRVWTRKFSSKGDLKQMPEQERLVSLKKTERLRTRM
jgi:hypothetical protein